jgi:hypothetical protein
MRFDLVLVALFLLAGTLALPAAAQVGRRRPVRGKEPEVGDKAPDFDLVLLEGEREKEEAGKVGAKAGGSSSKDTGEGKQKVEEPKKVRLSSFKGRKPVVLLFSSYT